MWCAGAKTCWGYQATAHWGCRGAALPWSGPAVVRTKTSSWSCLFSYPLLATFRILFGTDDWHASKGFHFCSVHQHLSYLSAGMQILAARRAHRASFLVLLLWMCCSYSFRIHSQYFEKQFWMFVTCESLWLPNKSPKPCLKAMLHSAFVSHRVPCAM